MTGQLLLASDLPSSAFDIDFGGVRHWEVEIYSDQDHLTLEAAVGQAINDWAIEEGCAPFAVTLVQMDYGAGIRTVRINELSPWCRYRLIPWKFRYVADYEDPVAKERNDRLMKAVVRAVTAAYDSYAPKSKTQDSAATIVSGGNLPSSM